MSFAQRYGPWAVVTGAGAGVGRAFVEELHSRDLGVVMVDVDPVVEHVATDLDGPTRVCVVDVTADAWTESLDATCEGLEVGLAVANAGISHTGWYLDMPPAPRRSMIELNCWSTAELASWALPSMVQRGRGGFVAVSSGSALCGTAGVALYSATKAFAVNLVEAIGWELRHTGVHAQAIVAPSMTTPGFVGSGADPAAMVVAPVEPRRVVAAALDDLHLGGRWLADEGLEFAAAVDRAGRVDMMSAATVAMYPDLGQRPS